MFTKKVLLLCSSHNDLGLIRALRKLGFYIIVTGNIENLVGQKWCDKFIKADYSNKELILEIAKKEKIDAICQCCNDFGVYTAAYVAEQLNLPGYDSYDTTLILHNKDRFKEFAKKHKLLTPEAVSFTDVEEAKKYAKLADYPIIIKPTDCSAGNGISKAENLDNAILAIDKAFEKSRSKRIVLEPYIEGSQHGFCTFLRNKKVVAICSNNEYSILNPYRVEIDTFPADNYELVKDILISEIEKIADLLSLKDGIFHLQYIYDGKRPMIIEVMRRILGNMYHIPGNNLNGIDWEYWETRAKCGLSCEKFPVNPLQEGFFAYKTLLANKNGIIKEINIPAVYEKYLDSSFMLHDTGYNVTNYKSSPIGFLFFTFPSSEVMKDVLIDNYINDIIKI